MLSWSSDMKKFNFFDENKYKDLYNIQNINDEKNDEEIKKKKENEINNNQEIDTININNVSISGPREFHAINGLLFINGKLIHDKDGKMIRENLIMKIFENKIIDLYRIFNGVYYSFELKIFKNKPYFIVIGGNFNEFIINNKVELFMITSIKIYNASDFILNKNGKYPPKNLLNSKQEPYPELLIKNIKLIKRLSDDKIMCELDQLSMEGYESFQNINSFSINSEFTHAAISLDKGDIILVYAYPNLIESNNNSIKMMFLPKINTKDKCHITNLFFTQIYGFKNSKRILYATTSKIIYYYEWNIEKANLFIDEENNIKLKTLNPGGPGAYNGCVDIREKYLLMGSSKDDFICEFENLEISKTWFFEGKKTNVYYFKDYLLFAVSGDRFSSLQVYDKKNSMFIYYKNTKKKIIGLCCDYNDIYIFYEKSQNYKYIMKLSEKSLKEKIQILFNKKFFDIAVTYAESYGLNQTTISNLSKLYAEQEYIKGDFNSSIQQYIKTIGFYEPSNVIQKFNKKSKISYLIIYLEKLLDYFEIKNKMNDEYENYTILLLNCYTIENKIQIFKKYIQKKSIYFSKELLKKIMNICLGINEIEYSFKLCKQKRMHNNYIEMLFKLNKKDEALNYIKHWNKNEKPLITYNAKNKYILNQYEIDEINRNARNYSTRSTNLIPCKEMINIFNHCVSYFMNEEENKNKEIDKNSLAYQFFEIFMNFIYKNYQIIEEKDMNLLMHNFLFYDKYFLMIFDKLVTYPITFDKKVFHRRIELYLEEFHNIKDEKDKIKEIIKKNIIDLLWNYKYKNNYDFEYLILIFKYYNFEEGIEIISDQKNSYDDFLFFLFDKKEYNKIIKIFKKNSPKERALWEKCLQIFLAHLKEKPKEEQQNKILKSTFQEFLSILLENEIIPSIEILQIINEINNEIPIELVKNFFLAVTKKENDTLVNNLVKSKEYEAGILEVEEEINNLKEKPINLRLIKCDECNMGIDFPVILFKCGHYYHVLCLNYYSKDLRNAHCPRCFIYKNKINKINMESEKIYNELNNEKGLEKELRKQSNHIDFINRLYSKGLFKFNIANK